MDTSAPADLVRARIAAAVDAWEAGDGAAYAEAFTADATYVTWIGTVYRGREEIGRAHQVLFDRFLKGSVLVDDIIGIKFLGADTAVVTSRGEVGKGGRRPAKLTKVQTYTLVREDGGDWRIAAFQNTKRKTIMERISFAFAPETAPV
ncbi:SgcJ/EcaC family oxidoreductase [Glycomyces paridis]|uniref:SgcJ/EcaC family oxidoreductase n=1 Tax=Glycomyces paridis TaxID=2126555 RepID=A0A4S8PJC6_9ACTN|nr:SgcJ/EcaC family oxidoreductase [Glycomyces paridis]THV30780.1 SgcJ/EcaC family oxidoreductase [Glycomyces paridis]